MLASDSGDEHNSAILRVVFSSDALLYTAYDWMEPYEEGTLFDDSAPILADLPTALNAETLSGLGYPAGIVDLELSNVVPSGSYGEGVLSTLTLHIPEEIEAGQTIRVDVEPDTIARGFLAIPTTAGETFALEIIPEPGTLAYLAIGLATAGAHPRRKVRVLGALKENRFCRDRGHRPQCARVRKDQRR